MASSSFLSSVRATIEPCKKGFKRKFPIWMWQSGLGNVLNAFPSLTGEQVVVTLPDNTKLALNCTEKDDVIYALLPAMENPEIYRTLVANPAVQIWSKNGWYNAGARLLTFEETAKTLSSFQPESFFGKIGASLRNPDQDARIRMIEIRRISACTGEKGPGQYAWVWAASSLFFFFSWAHQRKINKRTARKLKVCSSQSNKKK